MNQRNRDAQQRYSPCTFDKTTKVIKETPEISQIRGEPGLWFSAWRNPTFLPTCQKDVTLLKDAINCCTRE